MARAVLRNPNPGELAVAVASCSWYAKLQEDRFSIDQSSECFGHLDAKAVTVISFLRSQACFIALCMIPGRGLWWTWLHGLSAVE